MSTDKDLLLKVPAHIAFIMDGNRRWAKARGMLGIEGQRKGADSVITAVEFCANNGIKYMTMYAWSTENWKRPESEITGMMSLIKMFIKREINELNKNNIRIRFIGSRDKLQPDLVELFDHAEKITEGNDRLIINFAFNYGARSDIVNAAKELCLKSASGKINPDDIDEALFAQHLSTSHSPDPDLVIRTAGEQRLSNFLLWELSYAEMVFLDECWPELNNELLTRALKMYQTRERNFGNTSVAV